VWGERPSSRDGIAGSEVRPNGLLPQNGRARSDIIRRGDSVLSGHLVPEGARWREQHPFTYR
jgi:hypothetical protein